MKKYRPGSFVTDNRMSFRFCPGKLLQVGGTILALVLVIGGGVQAEEAAIVDAPKPKISVSKAGPVFELQLNSFKSESNAKKFVARLVKKSYEPFLMVVQNGETWFKVRMGPFPSKETAVQIATELKNKHGLSSIILLSRKPPAKKVTAKKLTPVKVAPENAGNNFDVVMSQFLVWLEAWQGKQLDSYFSFYSQSFESGGKPFKDWLKEQSKTLEETQQIKVEVNDLKMLDKGDTIEMSFVESFQSKSFSDIRRKVLVWKKEKGIWKIVVETSEPA
jgi:ketosteroid isomerase-like protein